MLESYTQSLDRKRPKFRGFGDFPFVLENFYDTSLIEELLKA